jgi:hypothetical protein
MRDYWLTQDILRAVGVGMMLLIILGVGLALWLPKKWWGKLLALCILGVIVGIPLQKTMEEKQRQQALMDAAKQRLELAEARFQERCKTAGEKILRSVDEVESFLLTNLRPADISDSSQYDSNDQYGYNVGGESYIRYYLIGSSDFSSRYRFVELISGSKKYKFWTPLSASISRQYWIRGSTVPIASNSINEFSSRYAVEWKDISTKEDRDLWIAGGSLLITDRKTNEVIAERIGYLLDTGLGSTAGQRSPWTWARHRGQACPAINEHNRAFVEKVLKPTREEVK